MTTISIKRIYEAPQSDDGFRVLLIVYGHVA